MRLFSVIGFLPIYRNWPAMGAVFLAVLLLLTACGNETELGNAARLVRAMQLDRMMLVSMQIPYRRGQLRNRGNEKLEKDDVRFYECIYSIDSSIFISTYADVLAKEMSIEEMRTAIRFLEGNVGKKYVQSTMVLLPEVFGLPELANKSKVELSKEELAAVEKFTQTAAGVKLWQKEIFEQKSVLFAAAAKWQDAVNGCVRSTQEKK